MTANPLPPIPPISATTGMAPSHGSSRFKPIDPVKVVRTHLWWLVGAGVLGLALGVGAYLVMNQTSPRWTSEAYLDVKAPIGSMEERSGSGPGGLSSDVIDRFKQTVAYRIRSEEILRQAIDTQLVRDTQWFKSYRSAVEARDALREDYLAVWPIRGSDIIQASVSTPKADDAKRILQAILDVYLRTVTSETREGIGEQLRIFSEARAKIEDDVARLDKQRRDFLVTYDLSSLNAQTSDASIVYNLLAKQNADLGFALAASREALDVLEERQKAGQLTATPEMMQQLEMMPDVLAITHRVNQLQEDVNAKIARYNENHKFTLDAKEALDAAKKQKAQVMELKVAEAIQAQLNGTQLQVRSLQGQIDTLAPKLREAQVRMADLNSKLAQYESIVSQVENLRETSMRYEQQIKDLEGTRERRDSMAVSLQQSPTEPEKTSPKITVIVPGVTLLFLGVTAGLIFLKELLDQRIKSPADVKLLPDAELLGVIPDASEDPSGPTGVERVVEKYPTGLISESFREVRTAILAKMDRRGYRTLMVVAGQPRAGVSTVAHNLATSLAYNGRKVVIVDLNFRRPAQHRLVGLSNEVGLVDVLHSRTRLEDAVTKLEGLTVSVLPTGGAADEAPECLECAAFRSVLAQLEADYDVVVIDAPPALLASESRLLAKHVDAMAIVVRAGVDQRGMVERMLKRLDGHRADILGIILNGVRSSAGGYFRQNYRDFYRYREGADLNEGRAKRSRREKAAAATAGNGNGNGKKNGRHAGDSNGNGKSRKADAFDDGDGSLN